MSLSSPQRDITTALEEEDSTRLVVDGDLALHEIPSISGNTLLGHKPNEHKKPPSLVSAYAGSGMKPPMGQATLFVSEGV